jgi:hypothetical protein
MVSLKLDTSSYMHNMYGTNIHLYIRIITITYVVYMHGYTYIFCTRTKLHVRFVSMYYSCYTGTSAFKCTHLRSMSVWCRTNLHTCRTRTVNRCNRFSRPPVTVAGRPVFSDRTEAVRPILWSVLSSGDLTGKRKTQGFYRGASLPAFGWFLRKRFPWRQLTLWSTFWSAAGDANCACASRLGQRPPMTKFILSLIVCVCVCVCVCVLRYTVFF